MTEIIPMPWHFSAITAAPKPNLRFVLLFMDLGPRGARAVGISLCCLTGQHSRRWERLESIHSSEEKKANFSAQHPEWLSKPAKWLQNSWFAFWRGRNITLSDLLESLTKAAVFLIFPVHSGSVGFWLSILVTNMMLIKTLETEILSRQAFSQKNALQLCEQSHHPVTFENKSHEATHLGMWPLAASAFSPL